jgi:hypothetical protein
MGMMNVDTVEMIDEKVGDVLEIDVDDDGMTLGRYLRVKDIDIRKPLLRGDYGK